VYIHRFVYVPDIFVKNTALESLKNYLSVVIKVGDRGIERKFLYILFSMYKL